MKKKTLTRFFGLALSAVMAVTSIQVPVLADGSDSMEKEQTQISVDASAVSGDVSEAVSGNEIEEEKDYHFTDTDTDLFALDVKGMSDEEISHTILSKDEMDVKAWLSSMSGDEKAELLARDTALSQTLDIYKEDENGVTATEHFDTYMDYLDSLDEKVGYKFTSTTGNYYINWYSGTTSEGQSCISVSGMKKGESDNTQQTDLTWKVVNSKHSLAIKSGGKKSWPNSLKSAQNKTNYQQPWADLTYTKPISYTAAVTYDSANSGSGDYKIFQGTHDSATGCLKSNSGAGEKYYVVSGTAYTGSSAYTAATTETFNIGPNFTNLGCTDNATNSSVVARITLNPVYMTLTWNQNGGSGSNCSPASVLYGNVHGQATAPARAGYTFAGWSGYSATAGVTANKTYTAAWNANQYIINYNGAGGTLSKTSDKVTYGGNIPTMPSASRAGYSFTGWTWSGYSGSGVYTYVGNSTATATWKANQYKINYDANGGQVSPASNGVTYGQPCPTAPTPTRTGYTFAGWTGGTYTGTYQTAGDTTVKAAWKANTYTISFNTDGGSQVDDLSATYDSNVTLPGAPAKEDYEFTGWSDGVNTYQAGAVVKNLTSVQDGKVTFKAMWIPSTFTIRFQTNGGSEVSDVKYHFGDNTALPIPVKADKKDGDTVTTYSFAGWMDGTGTIYTTAQDVKREALSQDGILNLSAVWNETETIVREIKIETREEKTEKTIVEKPVYETKTYTNHYGMTEEQAKSFLEKILNGMSSEITINGIRYEMILNGDGTITIRRADVGVNRVVTIPDSIRIGDSVIPVTVVEARAFKNNTSIKKVILGKNVTTIKESAFENCKALSEVTLNNGLLNIGAKAFKGCISLKKITIPKSVMKIGDQAFYNCKKLSKVNGGKGLVNIGAKAFMNCRKLKKFTLYTSVMTVGKKAFYGCKKLKKVTIKSKVLTKVGAKAFKKTHKKIAFKITDKEKKEAYEKLLKGRF